MYTTGISPGKQVCIKKMSTAGKLPYIRVFIAKTGFLKNWFHLCGTMPLMGCIFFNFLSIIAEVFLVSFLINVHLWIFWFIIQQNHNTFWGSFILKDFMSLGSENLSLSSNAMLYPKDIEYHLVEISFIKLHCISASTLSGLQGKKLMSNDL